MVFSVARYFLPRKIMQLVQDLHMHCYRLHLTFAALCQAISLEPPYYTKIDIQVTPIINQPDSPSQDLSAVPDRSTVRLGWFMVEVRGVEPRSFRLYC